MQTQPTTHPGKMQEKIGRNSKPSNYLRAQAIDKKLGFSFQINNYYLWEKPQDF
jgi:hypothetical protein